MKIIKMAFVAFLLLASTVHAQDWERFTTLTERLPDVQVLVLNPAIPCCTNRDRYVRIALKDLLKGLVRFPDNLLRYAIARNEYSPTADNIKSGNTVNGWSHAVRLPPAGSIEPAYLRKVYVAVPIPGEGESYWFSYGEDTANPGSNSFPDFMETGIVFTVDGVGYEVFQSRLGISNAETTMMAFYFDVNALPPAIPFGTLSIDGGFANEGSDVTFTITHTEPAGYTRLHNVTVGWTTAPFTAQPYDPATAGLDYTAATGTLTFAPGETAKTLTVTTLTDSLSSEETEAFTVEMRNLSGAKLRSRYSDDAYGYIRNVAP